MIHIKNLAIFNLLFYVKVSAFFARYTNYHNDERINLALGKPAEQSSTLGSYTADKGVDGSYSTNMMSKICMHTSLDVNKDPKPWFYVDLEKEYNIDSIEITNRGDCWPKSCNDRMSNFDVRVSNKANTPDFTEGTLCHHQSEAMMLGGKLEINCPDKTFGRYVSVKKSGKDVDGNYSPLQFCEIRVFEKNSSSKKLINLALGKPAEQSSTLGSYTADKGVDGSYSTNMMSKICMHTSLDINKDPKPWFYVDLEKEYNIDSIKITNRGDCWPKECNDRMSNFEINVGNSADPASFKDSILCHHQMDAMQLGGLLSTSCPENTRGRYVSVRKVGKDVSDNYSPLQFCEIRVYGEEPSVIKDEPKINNYIIA